MERSCRWQQNFILSIYSHNITSCLLLAFITCSIIFLLFYKKFYNTYVYNMKLDYNENKTNFSILTKKKVEILLLLTIFFCYLNKVLFWFLIFFPERNKNLLFLVRYVNLKIIFLYFGIETRKINEFSLIRQKRRREQKRDYFA